MSAGRGRSAAPQPLQAPRLPARLAKEPLPPVLVLAGAERWFRSRGVEHAIARVFPDGDPGGGVVHLDARRPEDKDRVPSALDELRSRSLFSRGKVVVVENPEAAPALVGGGRGGALLQLARAALEHPSEDALLVLSTAKPVKGREAVATKTLLGGGAWVVDCRALYDAPAPWERSSPAHDHELSRFLCARMSRLHGRRLPLEAAHALTLQVGSDLSTLDDALRSLALYIGERPEVALEDVARSVGHTREDPIWRLVDAVFDGEVGPALDLVTRAFEHGLGDARGASSTRPEALFPQIAAALHAAFRRILAGAEALQRGEAGEEVAKGQGVPPFLAQRFLERCRRDPARLLALHQAFLEAEVGVKGGGVPARLATERLVAALVTGLAVPAPARA